MIDEDFTPNRLQYRALGHLLVQANNFPLSPAIRESLLLEQVYGHYVGSDRQDWLTELEQNNLIRIEVDSFRANDRIGEIPVNICLTASGIYYCISRSFIFSENAYTPTDDFPDEIVDTPWAINSYFSPTGGIAPAADRYVRFDHNQQAYEVALTALDSVSQALAADNDIGANHPLVRDEKLAELTAIRQLLQAKEGWSAKLITIGWGVLGYLMSQFANRPVSYLAEKAWHALKLVVGHL